MNRRPLFLVISILALLILVAAVLFIQLSPKPAQSFDAQRAYQDVVLQVQFGPRLPGSEAHNRAVNWMVSELTKSGWQTEVQETTRMGHPIRNVIAKRGIGSAWVILGAHYDSRMVADNDPDPQNRTRPVPGANDGASGVAVLLELARVLPLDSDKTIWIVFFDAEDQGNLPSWDWIQGSRAFAESLTARPNAAIIIDMIGDANLNIYQEQNSNLALTSSIWQTAADLGYQAAFIPTRKHSIIDDHTPFIEKGIRAVDIIDIEYPHWHTVADTPDKVSPQSLKIIGETLIKWLSSPLP